MPDDVELAAADGDFLEGLKREGHWKGTREKAHSQIETRGYRRTDRIDRLARGNGWAGLRTLGFERTTIGRRDGSRSTSWRCFPTSLPPDIDMLATAIRGHWRIEATRNVLDATPGEDASRTCDRTAAENQNIVRRWVYSIPRHVDPGFKASMRSKACSLGLDPTPALEMLAPAAG